MRLLVALVSTLLFLSGAVQEKGEFTKSEQTKKVNKHDHASHVDMTNPHNQAEAEAVDAFMAKMVQHGPDVECKRLCAPKGFEGDVRDNPDGLEVVTCAGNKDDGVSCAKQGSHCGEEHRYGCAESCRAQCCACCSI